MPRHLDHKKIAEAVRPYRVLGRRRFLQASAATVVVGGAALQAGCTGPETPAAYPVIGSDWPVIKKFTETILPVAGDSRFPGFEQVPVFRNIDMLLATLESDVRSDLGKGLMLFNYGSLVLGFHFSRFVSLQPGAAVSYVRRWEGGSQIQRSLMWALKQIVYVSYWQEPATWPAIEYDGPVTLKYGIPRLGNAPLPQMEISDE